uniref:Putative trypsin-like serine protease n=1 Tax=Ixodes ricinus TaxID=34613 RepID=A0A147BG83_IXORI
MWTRPFMLLGTLVITAEAIYSPSFPRPLYQFGKRLAGTSLDTPAMIVGGRDARPAEFPFQAVLTGRTDGKFLAGGSLITEDYVLSCGHDLASQTAKNLTVWLGVHRKPFASSFLWRTSPSALLIHPEFNEAKFLNDIALIRLKDRVPLRRLGGYVNTIFLPPFGFEPRGRALVSGWGDLSENGPNADVLQVVELPLVNLRRCRQLSRFRIEDTNLCAGFAKGGKNACKGDSGGPLFQILNGTAVQIGIVSWGRSCALPNRPGVYTNVVPYLSWIRSIVAADNPSGAWRPASGQPGC